jgi:hypothetical protein
MKANHNYFLIIISTIFISGCVIYPQTFDIPLISEKNEIKIDAGVSVMPSASATVSYGLTNKMAVQASANIGSDNHYVQGAVGLFKNYGINNVMEIYAGLGTGYGDAYKSSMPGNLAGNYQLSFAQLNLGKRKLKFANMDIGAGLKTGLLTSNLTDKNYFYWYSEYGPFPNYKDLSALVQPSVVARIGGENLKFSLMVSGLWLHSFSENERQIPYSHFNVGIGLNYAFKIKNR